VTDNDVDEYESGEVKVVGKEQVYQILWERIKKPAKGEKSSLRILKCLEHDNALCCIVSAFDYADFVERNEHYVFESNIRKHRGGKGSINKGITKTLEEELNDLTQALREDLEKSSNEKPSKTSKELKNKINKKIKAVVACGNGTAGIFAPEILKGIGCDVIELDCNLDFTFPKYNPNPEDLKMLNAISKCVKDNNADIGFGFDGDGDRVGVIDNTSNEIFSDKIGLLIARNLSSEHKNSKFIVDVKSTGLYANDKILLKNNCKTIYWKTGHSHIKRKVREIEALAGFEKSGHFFFNKPLGLGYDDGILSAIQVCKLLDKNSPKKISDLLDEIPKTYQSPTMAPYCDDAEKYKVVDVVIQKFKELFEKKTKIAGKLISEILNINGVRFTLENGSWGLIRASSNKPSLVIVTESTQSMDEMKAIFSFIDNLLKATGKVGKYDQKI